MAYGEDRINEINSVIQNIKDRGGPLTMGDLGQAMGLAFAPIFDSKGKGAPRNPTPMVPTATGNFFQRTSQPDRSSLLQAMMQRSRAGRQMGAQPSA